MPMSPLIGFSGYFVVICGLKTATDVWVQKSNMTTGYVFHIFSPLASWF